MFVDVVLLMLSFVSQVTGHTIAGICQVTCFLHMERKKKREKKLKKEKKKKEKKKKKIKKKKKKNKTKQKNIVVSLDSKVMIWHGPKLVAELKEHQSWSFYVLHCGMFVCSG